MPNWPWKAKQSAAPAAPVQTSARSKVHDVNFVAEGTDGTIRGTVKVTIGPPHSLLPPPLHVAIEQAAGKVFAKTSIGSARSFAARAQMDLYQSASSKFKDAESVAAPGFQIVDIEIVG